MLDKTTIGILVLVIIFLVIIILILIANCDKTTVLNVKVPGWFKPQPKQEKPVKETPAEETNDSLNDKETLISVPVIKGRGSITDNRWGIDRAPYTELDKMQDFYSGETEVRAIGVPQRSATTYDQIEKSIRS